ncbi:MAG: hypothetical protein WD733_15350 [Bryobacterales bacterium]
MIVFPQLSSGAMAQFPFRRRTGFRTLVNQSADGSEIRASDVEFAERGWMLSANELSDAEWQAIEDLFVQSEGRLQSFLFLEPAANLLSWTEQLGDSVWSKGAGIAVLGGQSDPLDGLGATQITSAGTAGSISQALDAPASFRYAGSVWARSAQAGVLLQVDDGGSQQVQATIDSSNQWKRYSVGYNLASTSESVVFRVLLPASATVEVFGPQLEAQASPSAYKKTLEQAGVYPNARFDQDVLGDGLIGVGRHSGDIRISWTPSQT